MLTLQLLFSPSWRYYSTAPFPSIHLHILRWNLFKSIRLFTHGNAPFCSNQASDVVLANNPISLHDCKVWFDENWGASPGVPTYKLITK